VWANVHIIRVISTGAPAVWADRHLVVGHLLPSKLFLDLTGI
jgi:hypothetical protein